MKGRVYLIGMGMGNPETLTAEASAAIEECDLLLGATRLVEPYIHSGKELAPLIACLLYTSRQPPGRQRGRQNHRRPLLRLLLRGQGLLSILAAGR